MKEAKPVKAGTKSALETQHRYGRAHGEAVRVFKPKAGQRYTPETEGGRPLQ